MPVSLAKPPVATHASRTRCYSYAAAIAASGHPQPGRVLAAAYALHRNGCLGQRAAGVTQAMHRARNVAQCGAPGLRYGHAAGRYVTA
jgi:hypothetical protein